MPWFSRVVYVDDQVNYVYPSGTQRVEPGPVWMAQYEGPEFWDERTWWGQRYQKWYNASLNTLSQLYNQSEARQVPYHLRPLGAEYGEKALDSLTMGWCSMKEEC
ncbi:H-2 class I histocompatibility antigen, Q9 alpha chain-like [Natator depressus]|uniref:H-2 class I histocompatibility antigen, Q9 alpha chain-like n=1 Tax=Natator depressus TaxID=27790 RepID=UPI003EBE8E92